MIPQVSHAWLAWQLAEHWGNRRFARPAPRADVLAAILLHDGGWVEFDQAPGIDASGRPRTFDRMPVTDHLAIWRAGISRAAMHSRYAGLLVGSLILGFAQRKRTDLRRRQEEAAAAEVDAFLAEFEHQRTVWQQALAADPRYQGCLSGPGWEVNRRLLEACDRVSVYLCASFPPPIEIEVLTPGGELSEVTFEPIQDTSRTFRVTPWPLEGNRLRLQCEGRKLSGLAFASAEELQEEFTQAPVERLTFTLLRPSAKANPDRTPCGC